MQRSPISAIRRYPGSPQVSTATLQSTRIALEDVVAGRSQVVTLDEFHRELLADTDEVTEAHTLQAAARF